MSSEIWKLWKKFKKRGLAVYLTLIIFMSLLFLMAKMLFPILPPMALFIFSITMAAWAVIMRKYNFLKAFIDDLEKIPPKSHYIFFVMIFFVAFIIYLVCKLTIFAWLHTYVNKFYIQLKLNEQTN
jgi:hypothetical protein